MSTLTLQDPSAQQRADLMRWLLCGAVVLAAHAGLATALIGWRDPVIEEGDVGTGMVMIDLDPLPVTETKNDLPPGPEQVQSDPNPDKPVENTEQKVDPLPRQDSEVALAPSQEPQPRPQPHDALPPAPATTAPQSPAARAAVRSWQSQIVAMLERNKRYPPEARARGEQGIARLRFSIDRGGHLMASRIVGSSGSSALDRETLALVQRAQPFPPAPAGIAGSEISFTVPVRFNIR